MFCTSMPLVTRKFNYTTVCEKVKLVGNIRTRKLQQLSIFSEPPEPEANVYIKLRSDGASGYPYILSKEEEEMVTNGDSEAKVKLQEVLLYLYLKKEQGEDLPKTISIREFSELLFLKEEELDNMLQLLHSHHSMRMKTEVEKTAWRQTEKKNELEKEERYRTQEHPYLHYGTKENCLFTPILKKYQSCYYNYNMGQGLQYGQKIVFDCSFDEYMDVIQVRETANNLNGCISLNRRSRRPFSISFCNVEEGSRIIQYLKKFNPALGFDLPVHIHSNSYLNMFRKEEIVYLSPHVNQELVYHPEDIYVIGALSNNRRKLSLEKARAEGIRCAKVPIGVRQLVNKSNVLSIREVFQTLLSWKNQNIWSHQGDWPRKLQNHKIQKTKRWKSS